MSTDRLTDTRPHVVIVGGGFGGLTAAQALRNAPVRVTLVDRSNHHLFQPLLYQVAMAGLSPAEIASPIRGILRKQANTTVLLGEVTRVDLAGQRIFLGDEQIDYDFLVLATGAQTNYFGHDEWAPHALGLKSLDDAVEIRRRVLTAFEAAEREHDPAVRERLMTFVSIGGGPTGVETAGAVAELARFTLQRDFRTIDPRSARVILIEAGERILASFDPRLSADAVAQLADLGVEVRTTARVTRVDADGVALGDDFIPAATVIWAAGVRAAPMTSSLGVNLDRSGRVEVREDCSIPGHPEAFAIGDMAACLDAKGRPLPGLAPVAMQQARFVARGIVHATLGLPAGRFRYFDKGTMATIGRSRAIAEVGPVRLTGFLAWLAWLFVHLVLLIGFRNRFIVLFSWMLSYVTYGRGARLITAARVDLRERSAPVRASVVAPPPAPAPAQKRDPESAAAAG
jgi:NADH dehydrogenase